MNNAVMTRFNHWLENATGDPDLVAELIDIDRKLKSAQNSGDRAAEEKILTGINERFYRELEFGTGGLRGIIGAGSNRMNHYTVARATQGLADYVNSLGNASAETAVAIAYDSRRKSKYFAQVAARVLAANGIKAHLYDKLMPTPMLSWAVRRLKCRAGIVITASHNRAKYNGYKAYGSDGCQLGVAESEIVINRINKLDLFSEKDVRIADYDEAFTQGKISHINREVIDEYFAEVKAQSIHKNICAGAGLKVVYTPLNGAGNEPVRRILRETGVTDVTVVPSQENPDENFTTCPYPNPEFKEALAEGLKLCEQIQPDLLLATDPDADRVGIAVRDSAGEYLLFSGNEVGAMLLEYICRERKATGTMPLKQPIAVKSIVSTAIVDKIAAKYGVQMIDTLTGFKFIAGIAGELEKKGDVDRFIYGFEESYGYLPGSYVRDKDAVCACMLICEMAAFYRRQGISLTEARMKMYEEYGYYYHYTQNVEFPDLPEEEGKKRISDMMTKMRNSRPAKINGADVVSVSDYKKKQTTDLTTGKTSAIDLPESDVIKLTLSDESIVIIRPSGTEPKLKIYYTSIAPQPRESVEIQQRVMADVCKFLGIQ